MTSQFATRQRSACVDIAFSPFDFCMNLYIESYTTVTSRSFPSAIILYAETKKLQQKI